MLNASLNHDEIVRRCRNCWCRGTPATSTYGCRPEDDRQSAHVPSTGGDPRRRTGRPQYAAAHPGGPARVDDQPASALDPDRPLLCIPLLTHRSRWAC
ncbi:hypothetical protein GCM10023238_37270 [Streptomyces heliomycini]